MAGSASGIKAGRAYVELGVHDKLAAGLLAASRKLKAFGASVTTMGMKIAGVGLAAAAPMGLAVRSFADFERQMANVSTMLDDPDRFMAGFREGILQLSVESGESTDTLAKGLYDLLSASVPAARAMDVLGVAVRAAAGGATDTATAVDGLTSLINAYGLSAADATHVSDLMFATVKRGKLTFADLAGNIGKVAPMARAAGMGVEDMLAAIATMTRQGLSTEEATTRLTNILRTMPEAAQDIMAVAKRFRGQSLADILAVVPEALAAGGIAALAGDLAGLQTDLDMMANSAGAAGVAYDRMTRTSAHALGKLKQAFGSLLVRVGEALAPTVERIAAYLQRAATALGDWIRNNEGLVVAMAKIAASVVAAGVALVALGGMISTLGWALGGLSVVTRTAGLAFKLLGPLLLSLTTPTGMLIGALGALGVTLLVTSGAGGKALSWLGQRFEVLRSDAVAAYQGIANALAKGDIGLAMKVLWLTLKLEWTRGVNFLEKSWLNFRNFFVRIGYDAWHGLLSLAEETWHLLEIGWIETTAFFSKLWSGFVGFFLSTWERMKAESKKAWNVIKGLFDDSLNVEVANAAIDRERDAAIAGIRDDEQRKIAEREAQRQRERDKAYDVHEATMAQIGQANLDAHAQLDADYADRMAENERELETAMGNLQAALAEANAPPPPREDPDGPATAEDFQAQIQDALAGLEDLVASGGAGPGGRGTFNAAAIAALGAGTVEERQLTALEKIEAHNRRLVELSREREGIFVR